MSRTTYKVLLVIFIGFSSLSVYIQISSEIKTSDLELQANSIHSIQMHVSIESTTLKQPMSGKDTSVGISNAVALFSEDNTRYRFVTDYQYSTQQISENITRLDFIYNPEEPAQLSGKPISFLENMKVFACDYSSFFQLTGLQPSEINNSLSLTVFVNGIEVINIRDETVASEMLTSGQGNMDVSNEFANVNKEYFNRLKSKLNE